MGRLKLYRAAGGIKGMGINQLAGRTVYDTCLPMAEYSVTEHTQRWIK